MDINLIQADFGFLAKTNFFESMPEESHITILSVSTAEIRFSAEKFATLKAKITVRNLHLSMFVIIASRFLNKAETHAVNEA